MHAARRYGCVPLLLLLCTGAVMAVSATVRMSATRPANMVAEFSHAGEPGRIDGQPSLFGLPNYQADIVGRLGIPEEENKYGCADYDLETSLRTDEPLGKQVVVIALVARGGGCSFGVKALNAQKAGARAIVVYTTETGTQYPLPKMAGGDDTFSISIPGMLINYQNGQTLLGHVKEWLAVNNQTAGVNPSSPYYEGAWLSLHYSMIATGSHIEWDLFTYPDEANAATFLAAFQPAVEALGQRATFTPRYSIMDGSQKGCTLGVGEVCSEANKDALSCGNQCTNCGRYCRVDPDGDLATSPNGDDAVIESAVQKCLWQWGSQNAQPLLWWKYVAARRVANCGHSTTPSACSEQAMTAAGVPAAARSFIASCRGNMDPYADAENDLLEAELHWRSEWQPLTSFYMFANNFTYHGGFSCPDPLHVSTCGPLSMMCMGFAAGSQPAICTPNGCEGGVARDACGVCGGAATDAAMCGSTGLEGSSSTAATAGTSDSSSTGSGPAGPDGFTSTGTTGASNITEFKPPYDDLGSAAGLSAALPVAIGTMAALLVATRSV